LSKTVWLGVLQIIAAVALYLGTELDAKPHWSVSEILLLVNGVLMVIVRWLTDQPITSVTKKFDSLRPRIKQNEDARRYMVK
jgi:hypothetical protein